MSIFMKKMSLCCQTTNKPSSRHPDSRLNLQAWLMRQTTHIHSNDQTRLPTWMWHRLRLTQSTLAPQMLVLLSSCGSPLPCVVELAHGFANASAISRHVSRRHVYLRGSSVNFSSHIPDCSERSPATILPAANAQTRRNFRKFICFKVALLVPLALSSTKFGLTWIRARYCFPSWLAARSLNITGE